MAGTEKLLTRALPARGTVRLPLLPGDSPDEAVRLLDTIASDVAPAPAGDPQRIRCGYWELELREVAAGEWEVWEPSEDRKELRRGASLALHFAAEQRVTCADAGARFDPPRFDQLAAVSAGVREGDPLQAVRYPSPPHMSGWWFTTDRYDGNIKSLKVEHLWHLTAARRALAPILALPFGFRAVLAPGEPARIWFDPKAAEDVTP